MQNGRPPMVDRPCVAPAVVWLLPADPGRPATLTHGPLRPRWAVRRLLLVVIVLIVVLVIVVIAGSDEQAAETGVITVVIVTGVTVGRSKVKLDVTIVVVAL